MGLKRVSWVRRYQGQCRALRPLGHQGYRLRNHKKDPPQCSGYTRTEIVKIAKVATAAQRELDIGRGDTRLLNKVINGLQQRLDRLEGPGSVGSDPQPLESGSSDDGWGPGPGPGRAHAPGGAPRSRPSASAPSLSAPSHHSAGRRNERVPPGSGSEEWRDEWLSAEYHNHRAPPRTPVHP